MHVGIPCTCAYNAFQMSMAAPHIPFLDMHARHAAGPDMVMAAAYGASVGSKMAKLQGAKGFIGSSLDQTAHFYDTEEGIGTMPHVLIGYAGSTLDAVKLFIERNPDDRNIVALVDYHGAEYTDALDVAEFFSRLIDQHGYKDYRLGIRLDTSGNRYAERLDYEKSVEVMENWLHVEGVWQIVRQVMGDEANEIADDAVKDRVRALLFGPGVSAASIVKMRTLLNAHGHKNVQIIASSGFDVRKCRVMARARVPIDVIGTGSFLPKDLSAAFATADCYQYDGKFKVKEGRASIFRGL
jgi:nicotinate phosphoribosyltransferase